MIETKPHNQTRINNLQYLKERRRDLRNNPTPTETQLWEKLAKRQLGGFKFRRQHSINHYIVDFYCPQLKLIIEVDGEIHDQPKNKEHDHLRDLELTEQGFHVLRFRNQEVQSNIENVIEKILSFIASRI